MGPEDGADFAPEIVDQLVDVLHRAGGYLATHDLLARFENRMPGYQDSLVLQHLLGLVTQGQVTTRSDHGTVYFALRTPAS